MSPTGKKTPPARDDSTYEARRAALAESALRVLGELGYARTSLHDIAAKSDPAHGAVHHYFRDKTELITYCVRYYKARCVHRYDGGVEGAKSASQLLDGFAEKLCETITLEGAMHRLWYDLRARSVDDEALRPEVLAIDAALEAMIRRVLTRYAALAERPLAVTSATAYAMLDGLFERALLRWLSGDGEALATLKATVVATLPRVLGEVGRG